MVKVKTLFLQTSVASLCLVCLAGRATPGLNLYIWSDYVPKDVISDFTKETGIPVTVDIYDSNNTLQTKLLSGGSNFDIVVPTSHYMTKEIEAGALQKLDKSKIPNLANLDRNLMKILENADPGNQYGAPYAQGSTGLGINVEKVTAILGKDVPLDSWDLLFNPKQISKLSKCGVSVVDESGDIFHAALHYLKKDPNTSNPADYWAALDLMKTIRPYITQFNSTSYKDDLANGDVCVAFGWSGDIAAARLAATASKKSYSIRYVIPKEGAQIWFDMMAIPKDSPNPDAAMKWVNYVEQPAINARITNLTLFPTAVTAARKLVNPELATDPGIYPPPDVLSKMYLMRAQTSEILKLQNRLWTKFKTGQ